MAEEIEKETGAHETRDINAGAVAGFGAGVVVSLVAIFFAMRLLLASLGKPHPANAVAAQLELPPALRLQVDPASEMQLFRERENALLNSYGWMDREAGAVRIPIERAMEILAQRGLPASPGGGKTPLEMRQQKAKEPKP